LTLKCKVCVFHRLNVNIQIQVNIYLYVCHEQIIIYNLHIMKTIKDFIHLENFRHLNTFGKIMNIAGLIVAISLMACSLTLMYVLMFLK